jgi:hypothetical protein
MGSKRYLLMLLLAFTTLASAQEIKPSYFEVLVGDKASCGKVADALGESVRIRALSIPGAHDAGTPLKFTFTLEKDRQLSEVEWMKEYSNVSLNSVIERPYTKFIHHEPTPSLIDYFFSKDTTQSFDAVTMVEPNIGGIARLRLSLFLNGKADRCLLGTYLDLMTNIRSRAPDIIPPLVKKMEYGKSSYVPGDKAVVRFYLSKPLDKPESDHIEFVNRNIPIGKPSSAIPKYGPIHNLKELGGNGYEFVFDIPLSTLPGNYYPGFFNRKDKLGNFEYRIGKEDDTEQQVVEDSPLIVSG